MKKRKINPLFIYSFNYFSIYLFFCFLYIDSTLSTHFRMIILLVESQPCSRTLLENTKIVNTVSEASVAILDSILYTPFSNSSVSFYRIFLNHFKIHLKMFRILFRKFSNTAFTHTFRALQNVFYAIYYRNTLVIFLNSRYLL